MKNRKTGILFLGYRPSKSKIKKHMIKLIEEGKIAVKVNYNKDAIEYEYEE